MPEVNDDQFRERLETKLEDFWDRAFTIFRRYRKLYSYKVFTALSYAVAQGKVHKVLTRLEWHYMDHIQHHHPETLGTIKILGVNPTEEVFRKIYKDVLELTLVESSGITAEA